MLAEKYRLPAGPKIDDGREHRARMQHDEQKHHFRAGWIQPHEFLGQNQDYEGNLGIISSLGLLSLPSFGL